ncbi:MAG: response regulator, partial [Clostridia bacterium]|nr:response regulator [Clostridia bacterium]
MLNIFLLDEIAEHNTLLRTLLEKNLQALGEEAEYHFAVNAREAAAFAEQAKPHSVYFLDIELGDDENGIDAACRIHEADPDGYIVYVSAYQQYAMDCLHSHVFDFLAKPVSSEEIFACLKAILKEMKKSPLRRKKKLLFSADKRDYYIPAADITLIKSNRNFCETT